MDIRQKAALCLSAKRGIVMHDFFTRHRLNKICSIVDDNIYISALRRGLRLSFPYFMLGSLALVLLDLPIPAYQRWFSTVLDGRLISIFFWIYQATMGILALILISSVSYFFGQSVDPANSGCYPLTCLVSYVVFILNPKGEFDFSVLGSSWMFTAVVITLGCCALLRTLLRHTHKWNIRHYQEGIDLDFQNVMFSLFPIAICIFTVLTVKLLLFQVLNSIDLLNFGPAVFTPLFERVGTGLGGAILFIFLIHIFWFFGIHGSNMLDMVSVDMFETGMESNIAAVAAGEIPQVLFTKTFFDNFILLGGSGATLCLLLALMLRRERSNTENLMRISIIPSFFNINEMVLFGLPVVFNPIMLIPFLLVPQVLLLTSASAMSLGLVPYCIQQVQWTTPVIFGGILSTGSWSGAVLQIVNLAIGTVIYLPFIRLSEKYHSDLLKQNISSLRNLVMESEETGVSLDLHSLSCTPLHEIIKQLTSDLRYALSNHKISLFYQPQFSSNGKLYGVEALLRWNHPSLNQFLYPPMVLKLAQEDGLLLQMGYQIIETTACALERLSRETKYPIHMAVNIMPIQLEDPAFCENVRKILSAHDFGKCVLCFEVTEQIALSSTDVIQQRIKTLQDMGIPFHMDDFGMGHSSMIYLQDTEFSAVKLDGSLVRDLLTNQRAQEIISGIHQMSQTLHFDLIAEYVETQEQRETLNALGCHIYQGYLYSRALSLNDLELYLQANSVIDTILPQPPAEQELFL